MADIVEPREYICYKCEQMVSVDVRSEDGELVCGNPQCREVGFVHKVEEEEEETAREESGPTAGALPGFRFVVETFTQGGMQASTQGDTQEGTQEGTQEDAEEGIQEGAQGVAQGGAPSAETEQRAELPGNGFIQFVLPDGAENWFNSFQQVFTMLNGLRTDGEAQLFVSRMTDGGNGVREFVRMSEFGQATHFGDYVFGDDALDAVIQHLPVNAGNPPAAKNAVNALPTLKVTELLLSREEECAVCKEDFQLGQIVLQMPCSHVFCEACLKQWLTRHNTCPTCRYELRTDDALYEARRAMSQAGIDVTNAPEGETSMPPQA